MIKVYPYIFIYYLKNLIIKNIGFHTIDDSSRITRSFLSNNRINDNMTTEPSPKYCFKL